MKKHHPKTHRYFTAPIGFLPVRATFVHLRGQHFGSGTLTHVPQKGDWVELGEDTYLVKRLVWNLNHDPQTVEIFVDYPEVGEPLLTLDHNIAVIQALSELRPEA